jgi:hypothetical protein
LTELRWQSRSDNRYSSICQSPAREIIGSPLSLDLNFAV